jgi:hypothetical protein
MEDKMVELTRFGNPTEAEMLVNLLHSEGIDSYVRDAILSQEFMGYVDIGGAKVELLEKDLERARQIMRDNGYDVPDESDELIEAEAADLTELEEAKAEYEKNKAGLSRRMMFIVVFLLIILALLIFLNEFYK